MNPQQERSIDSGPGAHVSLDRAVGWTPILMYHRVAPDDGKPDPFKLRLSPAAFDAHISFLKQKGYRPLTFAAWAAGEDCLNKRQRSVVITFDDGYLDVYEYALPILARHGFPATVFLVSSYLGAVNQWDLGRAPALPLVSASQAREMGSRGIELGSHSVSHRPLDLIAPQEAWQELAESKDELEQALGQEVRTFSYPYGRSDASTREMARLAGYAGACGVKPTSHTIFNASRVNAALFRTTGPVWRATLGGVPFLLHRHALLRRARAVLRGPRRPSPYRLDHLVQKPNVPARPPGVPKPKVHP